MFTDYYSFAETVKIIAKQDNVVLFNRNRY